MPFWAVHALATGLNRYRDSHTDSKVGGKSLGEAFEVEGGQGKRPRIQKAIKEDRDRRIAIRLVFLEEVGVKMEAAIQQVADATGLSFKTVFNHWTRDAERARDALKRHRAMQIPSG